MICEYVARRLMTETQPGQEGANCHKPFHNPHEVHSTAGPEGEIQFCAKCKMTNPDRLQSEGCPGELSHGSIDGGCILADPDPHMKANVAADIWRPSTARKFYVVAMICLIIFAASEIVISAN